jgi:MSHA biogenesis protein MshI
MKLPFLRNGWPRRSGAAPHACVALSAREGEAGLQFAFARAEPQGDGVVVVRHGEGGMAQLAQATAAGVFRDASAVLVLDADQRQLVVLDRPPVPPEEMRDALRWPAAAALELPAEDLLLDAAELPPLNDAGKAQMLVVATPVPRLQPIQQLLERAGVRLSAVDSMDMAQRNAVLVQAPAAAASAAHVVVGISGGELLVGLVAGGELCVTRNLTLPSGFARDANDPAVVERLALHVQRAVDLFERQITRFAIVGAFLVAEDFDPALAEALRQVLPGTVRAVSLADLARPAAEGPPTAPTGLRARLAATATLRCRDARGTTT